ncbi:hypothetical protein [Methanobrevibacter sp.]
MKNRKDDFYEHVLGLAIDCSICFVCCTSAIKSYVFNGVFINSRTLCRER